MSGIQTKKSRMKSYNDLFCCCDNIPFSKKKQKEDGGVEGEHFPKLYLVRKQCVQGQFSLQDQKQSIQYNSYDNLLGWSAIH